MRNFTIYLALFLCSILSKTYAQETFESKIKTISNNIETITIEEKEALKKQVEAINVAFDKGSITKQQADDQKIQMATQSAAAIEKRIAVEEAKISDLVKEKVDGKIANADSTKGKKRSISIVYSGKKEKDTVQKSEKRTTSQFVFAAGINNVMSNDRLSHSDFRYLGSHFYEWGFTYNTRLAKESNVAHIKYGLSLMYNNLRPTDNRTFQTLGNQTYLLTSALKLEDSRFRNVNIVVPIHFELDFTKSKVVNDKTIFKSHEGFRIGFGGFAGVNIKSKQILKFEDVSGNSVTQRSKGDFNVNDFVYGVSSYIGYKETSLYVKYDLNPLFTDNAVKQNNISLGVRFDLN